MATSVARRRSVRERSPSPITRLKRLMASPPGPDGCTPTSSASPCVHARRCFGGAGRAGSGRSLPSRSVSPLIVAGRSLPHQGGARRRCRRHRPDRRLHRRERREWSCDLVEQGLDLRAIIDIAGVSSDARICPLAASNPMCSFRQDRRLRVPCFSISHSPGPYKRRPVLSTSR